MGDYRLNKYLLLILALLVATIFILEPKNGGIMGIGTNHYDNGEVSFDYPSSWNMTNGTNSTLVSFTDTNGLNVTVHKQVVPEGYNFMARTILSGAGNVDPNFKLVSAKNITVNGKNAYEINYNINTKNGQQQRKEVWFEGNNLVYNVIFTTPGSFQSNSQLSINSGNSASDTVINSLKINQTNKTSRLSTGWAVLQMPTLGRTWTITTTTADMWGAVYHIPTSYFPGENGEFALMGHHTTHHKPFANIETVLKVGDPLIVKDYLTGKKYTYKVTSNGNDIRWGEKGDTIYYKATNKPELLLITCWPPGYSRGAYIIHSSLVSVEPLT